MSNPNNSALMKANAIKRRTLSWEQVRLPFVGPDGTVESSLIELPVASFLRNPEGTEIAVPLRVVFPELNFLYARTTLTFRIQRDLEFNELRGHPVALQTFNEPSKAFRRDRRKLRTNFDVEYEGRVYRVTFVAYPPNTSTNSQRRRIAVRLTNSFTGLFGRGDFFGFLYLLFSTKKAIHNLRKIARGSSFQIEGIKLVSGPAGSYQLQPEQFFERVE